MTSSPSIPDTSPDSRKPVSSRSALRLLCRLGQGGMAEVHLASRSHHSGAADLVVVKRMHQQHVEDAATVRMFLDEARLALNLNHPNVVRTERLGTFGGRHGIVMEFLEGQPFHHVLKRAYEVEGTVHLDLIVQIGIAALDGLHYAHELKNAEGNPMQIVHRDISPQNLFITYEGSVKLLDFGIAKNAMQDGRTRTGLLKGKISYMAPEQARGETIDRRADLWSLGVMLWEAVTGSRLFKGNNEAATLNMTLSAEVAPPSQRRADLPPDLEAILMRALERDATKRYATAAAMRDDLELWLTGRDFSADGLLPSFMQRLFSEEMAAQREQINQLLRSPPEPTPESGVTLIAPLLAGSATMSGLSGLRATQMSSVTDLMQELTRQRRTTTRLLAVLVALVALALLVALVVFVPRSQDVAHAAQASAASPLPPPTAAPVSSSIAPAREVQTALPAIAAPSRAAPSLAPGAPTWSASRTAARSRARARDGVAAESEPAVVGDPVPQTGTLNFDTSPWSVVSIGGRVLGTTPIVGATLPAGTHALVLVNPELGLKTNYQVTITAGRTTARRIGLD